MSIPNSPTVPPHQPFPPGKFILYVSESVSVLQLSSFVSFFKILHISGITRYYTFLSQSVGSA